ncbi:hypothetical protein ACH5AJ_36370 [Streptomyces rochei]|uniref:hypothetical protein n=1 Tax=Streptomyces rochei TaxID=1928 RepID=UPI0037A8F226
MDERPHDGPPHLARSVPGGRPPTPDGDRFPQPPRAPAPVRWPGWVIAAVVLVLMVARIAGVLR